VPLRSSRTVLRLPFPGSAFFVRVGVVVLFVVGPGRREPILPMRPGRPIQLASPVLTVMAFFWEGSISVGGEELWLSQAEDARIPKRGGANPLQTVSQRLCPPTVDFVGLGRLCLPLRGKLPSQGLAVGDWW